MKTISGNEDLNKLGINLLTGEACAFSMRILCDLSADGVALMQDFFGLNYNAFTANWNGYVGDQPAVASIMLPHQFLPMIVRFALFREGFRYVIGHENSSNCTGYNEEDIERSPAIKATFELIREGKCSYMPDAKVYVNPKPASNQPAVGSRNIHMASGRVS